MNLAVDPVAWACRYRNSATSFSVVFAAREEVEGFGGRAARKSPYAGPSWSFTSVIGLEFAIVDGRSVQTIYAVALCQVSVVLRGKEVVAISPDDAFEVSRCSSAHCWLQHGIILKPGALPSIYIEEEALHLALIK